MKKIIELAENYLVGTRILTLEGDYYKCGVGYELAKAIAKRRTLEQTPITEEWLKEHGWIFDYTINECVADYHYVTCNGYVKRGEGYLLDWCNGLLNIVNDFNGAQFTKYDATLADLYDALELCNIQID